MMNRTTEHWNKRDIIEKITRFLEIKSYVPNLGVFKQTVMQVSTILYS